MEPFLTTILISLSLFSLVCLHLARLFHAEVLQLRQENDSLQKNILEKIDFLITKEQVSEWPKSDKQPFENLPALTRKEILSFCGKNYRLSEPETIEFYNTHQRKPSIDEVAKIIQKR